jgi:hypothetical protein
MNKLNIGIPTYNRSEILVDNIKKMNEYLMVNNIDIYIYDDSPNTLTKDAIYKLQTNNGYTNIHYKQNIPSLGHDSNCLEVLSNTPGEYIWYLGDSFVITKKGIEFVLNAINDRQCDAIINTVENRTNIISNNNFKDSREFYRTLSWHATLTSSTVYNNKTIKRAIETSDLSRFINSNFMQLAILLEGICTETVNIEFNKKPCLTVNSEKKEAYWRSKPIETFCSDWYNFNMQLNDFYSVVDKKIAIKNHDKNVGLFSPLRILYMHGLGDMKYSTYKKYRNECEHAINANKIIVKSMLLIPTFILYIPARILKKFQ